MGLIVLKVTIIGKAASSLLRVAYLETEQGLRLHTPLYAAKIEDIGNYVDIIRLAELQGVVELNISTPKPHLYTDVIRALEQAEVPYYIVIKPTLVNEYGIDSEKIAKLLIRLRRAASYSNYVTTLVPDTLFERIPRETRDYCKEYSCTYMLSSSLQALSQTTKSLQAYRELSMQGIAEQNIIAYSCLRAYSLSKHRRRILALIKAIVGDDTLITIYGGATAKTLNTLPFLGIAAELAQYYIGVDITGPTRSPRGAPQQEPRRRLLLAKQLLYVDLKGLQRGDKNIIAILERTKDEYQELARSSEELEALLPPQLEIYNIEKRLHYVQMLRVQDPDQLLEQALQFYRENNLQEALEKIYDALNYMKEAVKQRKITTYLPGNHTP